MDLSQSLKIPSALIITGPTASGKTYLSEQLIKKFPAQVINADIGQFYQPLSIGTAKPDLKNIFYQTHLFDIADKPIDITVVAYRKMVKALVDELFQQGESPVIVGGSLFYLKSLFFPPCEHFGAMKIKKTRTNDIKDLWQQLFEIDPVRAKEINQNDVYRINRALDIWEQTGVLPSLYKPRLNLPFRACIVFVQPPKEILHEKILLRTEHMIIKDGWLDEARRLRGTAWEQFLIKKRLIGYNEIFTWLAAGEKKEDLPSLIQRIQISTMQYAKRQITFWTSFKKQLEKESVIAEKKIKIMVVKNVSQKTIDEVSDAWADFNNSQAREHTS
jgi:tRNA dimethylallyltransferase